MVYINAEGVQKNVKTLDAKLVQREVKGAAVGKTMRVVGGTHAGLLCEVLAVEPKVRAWGAPVLVWRGGCLVRRGDRGASAPHWLHGVLTSVAAAWA